MPNIEEFKYICKECLYSQDEGGYKFKKLLEKASIAERKLWYSKFDYFFQSPVVYAVFKENIEIMNIIIEQMQEDNICFYTPTNVDNESILTIATKKNNFRLIAEILKYNPPVTMDNSKKKNSALHEAAKNGYIRICKLLINSKGFENILHVKDANSFTPINYLIFYDLFEEPKEREDFIVELLYVYPVHKNDYPLDNYNASYLHYAVVYCLYDVVATLLESGLNPKEKTFLGATAESIARSHYYPDIYKLILKYSSENFLRYYIKLITYKLNRNIGICCATDIQYDQIVNY